MDKIICVGKNYLEHAKELGDAVPEKPVLFLKPPSVLISAAPLATTHVPLPRDRGSVHHECEIVLKLRADGSVEAVTLGLDMTLRDIQSGLKKAGHPWEISKVFAGSAIVGPWISISEFEEYLKTPFEFSIDGVVRQRGIGIEMRTSPQECIRYARECFPIVEGDLLFTGTPAGVGPVTPGLTGDLCWGSHVSYRVRWT